MKKALLIVLTALSALGMLGEANAASALEGYFVRSVDTAMIGYENQEKCEADSGRWYDGDCVFASEDSVSVRAAEAGVKLAIETTGPTGEMCEFTATASYTSEKTLVAASPVQEWTGAEFVPATCEVAVTSLEDGSVNVRTNGKCQMFCGARASLEIDSAKRK